MAVSATPNTIPANIRKMVAANDEFPDKVILARPGGLTLSDAAAPQQQSGAHALTFDSKRWSLDREADYTQRQFDLVRAAAETPFTGRTVPRL